MLKNIKRKKEVFLLLTILCIIISTFFFSGILTDQTRSFHKENMEFESQKVDVKFAGVYTNITIDDSPGSPNNWDWAKNQPWCSGLGTLLDPYIIEGQILNMSISTHGIRITNSISSYFVIRNSIIQWNQEDNTFRMTGIFLSNTSKGQIVNNTVYDLTKGIHLNNISNVKIISNTIYDHTITNHMEEGILVENSYFLNVSKNKIYDISGTGNGMFLNSSFFNNITDNKIYDIANGNGVRLENSSSNKVSENIVYNNEVGITLQASHNNTFSRNNVSNNADHGLVLDQSHNNSILENNIKDNTQEGIYIVNSHNNTIVKSEIKDNTINGIYVSNSDDNVISENKIQNNGDGIHLINSRFNSLSENTIYNNTQHGVHLDDSGLNVIMANIIWENGENGINFIQSQNNVISDSYIYNNGLHGISLDSVSDQNNISKNRIYDNIENGINLKDSFNLNIWDNNIHNNGLNGILSHDGEYGTFYGNIIQNNSDMGVYLNSSTWRNVFYENFFRNNGKHVVDDGSNNEWNTTIIGNYWDNHTGPDTTPNDGIVDVPYAYIGGSAGSIDSLPIADDSPPTIIINSPYPGDIFVSTAPSFNVRVTDKYLDSMWYTLDGGIQNFTFTANGTIDQTAWDYLASNNITLQFYASDKPGNIATASVIIEKDTQAPIITIHSPTDGEVLGATASSFDITIVDSNLDTVWYSLDGGLNNYTISAFTGTFDQSAWDALSQGEVTITIYANDTAGNLAFEEVTITFRIPAGGRIGMDFFMTSFLLILMGGMAVIIVITRMYSKRKVIF